MKIGVPKEIKVHEYRVGLTPSSVRELVAHGHQVVVERSAGAGIGAADAVYEKAGATIVASADEVFAGRRHDREGEGAAAGRDRAASTRPGPLHLPAPRAGPGAVQGAHGERRGVHRLRDGHPGRRRPAAARAHVGGRGTHGGAGRRDLPREGERRHGHPAGRRGGRAAGQDRDPRRRRRRLQRRADGGRLGRHRGRHRPQHRRAAPHRPPARRARDHRLLQPRQHRAPRAHGGPGHRRRARPRRRGAEARHARARVAHEAGLGGGGRRHRPGRLLRDLARHDARRPHLRRRRRGALLRGQHARRGAAHVHLRAQQRDAALHAAAGRPGLEARARRPTRTCGPASTCARAR